MGRAKLWFAVRRILDPFSASLPHPTGQHYGSLTPHRHNEGIAALQWRASPFPPLRLRRRFWCGTIAFFLTVSLVSDPKGRRWVHFVNRKGKPALGADHPNVATTYNNLGNVCKSKADYDAASEYHEKALAIKLRTLGADQGGGFGGVWG